MQSSETIQKEKEPEHAHEWALSSIWKMDTPDRSTTALSVWRCMDCGHQDVVYGDWIWDEFQE